MKFYLFNRELPLPEANSKPTEVADTLVREYEERAGERLTVSTLEAAMEYDPGKEKFLALDAESRTYYAEEWVRDELDNQYYFHQT